MVAPGGMIEVKEKEVIATKETMNRGTDTYRRIFLEGKAQVMIQDIDPAVFTLKCVACGKVRAYAQLDQQPG